MEFLPIIGIALLFWLFIIRPASRRQKELSRMQSSLSVGDEVVLTSGVYGVVTGLENDRVQLRIADGVVIEVARGAIGSITTQVEEPAEPDDEDQPGATTGTEES